MRRISTSLVIVSTAVALVGCGDAEPTDRVANTATGGEDGSATGEGDDGSLDSGAQIPADWPDDIPLPEADYEVELASSQSDGERAFHQALFDVETDPDDLQSYYEDALSGEGWNVGTREITGGEERLLMVSGAKPDQGRDITVVVRDIGEGRAEVRVESMTEPG